MLGPSWSHFLRFLGVLLASQLKIAFETIFDQFSTAWRTKNDQKPLVFASEFEDARFCDMLARETDLVSISVLFWNSKSVQNRTQDSSHKYQTSLSFSNAV